VAAIAVAAAAITTGALADVDVAEMPNPKNQNIIFN
jgi:hypothetical protein